MFCLSASGQVKLSSNFSAYGNDQWWKTRGHFHVSFAPKLLQSGIYFLHSSNSLKNGKVVCSNTLLIDAYSMVKTLYLTCIYNEQKTTLS